MRTRFVRAPLGLGLVALALAGCGGGNGLNTGGALTGKVSIDGKPIKGGNVLVVSEDGTRSASGFVNGEGAYSVPEPPMGKVRISLQTSHLRGSFVPKTGERAGGKGEGSRGMVMPDPKDIGLEFTAIPDKYEKPETSGLTTEVKGGSETYDLTLSSK